MYASGWFIHFGQIGLDYWLLSKLPLWFLPLALFASTVIVSLCRCLEIVPSLPPSLPRRLSPCDYDVYYSGGRGRRVYRTDFRTSESVLVCTTKSEVLDMALERGEMGGGGRWRRLVCFSGTILAPFHVECTAPPGR